MKDIRTNILIKILKNIYNQRPIAPSVQEMQIFNGSILIIAPHADDEIVGCGGVMQECIRRNLNVYVLCITVEDERSVVKPTYKSGTNIRILESLEVKNFMGYVSIVHLHIPERSDYSNEIFQCIQRKLFEMFSLLKIETLFVPNYFDKNPDHRKICSIVLESTNIYINNNDDNCLILLYLYEVWGPTNATHYYILSEKQYQKKLAAMKMYKTQMKSADYCQIIETINNLREISFNQNYPSSYNSDKPFSNKEFYELIEFDCLPEFLTIINKLL